ncbi:2OG-Fe(II) oxygenase [Sulfurimonas sp. HSL-1716]|uniref:2OG-Fe(II) oxygenase n=1 Tax=Hydrocurvibacter sulfurireducens TaxID=3131937 RepID=UPI0031F855F5
MVQISEHIFCDDSIQECYMESKLLPNPYHKYPFLIIEDFFTQEECNLIVSDVKNDAQADKAMVKTTLLNSVVSPSVVEEIRKTSIYDLDEHFKSLYYKNFQLYQPKIEKFFSMALTTATDIQVLEYKTGDFYIKHADDSNEILDKNGHTTGFICVAPQRKLTTVLFISSHKANADEKTVNSFEGGELIFNYLYDAKGHQVKLQPKAGDMLVFLSNPVFSHEVLPVKSGYRATLVQWHNSIS